jgi:hypothetical protein
VSGQHHSDERDWPGKASHTGNIAVAEFVCLNPSDLTFVAHFTLTAANGDQVFGIATRYGVLTSATSCTVRATGFSMAVQDDLSAPRGAILHSAALNE